MQDRGYETLELEREGPILRVWLNRPERRNAISPQMLREVGDLYQSLESDFATRVVVLGGRGMSFCAGSDRKPAAAEPPRDRPPGDRELRWMAGLGRRACRAIEECEALTIARVHGHAIGGGCCFALSCDFRVASKDALFRVPEVDLGIPLSWAAVPRMIQEIGAARTREVILLCENIKGRKAERWGLVHRSVESEDLDTEVQRLVDQLLEKPELAVYQTKTQLRGYARLMALGDASETDVDMIGVASRSASAAGRFAMPKQKKTE